MAERFMSYDFTAPHSFTSEIEGPSCDAVGNLYAVNYARKGTVGRICPDGKGRIFATLPGTSVGCGTVFGPPDGLFIADYVNHTIFRLDLKTGALQLYAHEPRMHQPNDLALSRDGTLYASDPDWERSAGQLWRVDVAGSAELLADGLGTTNGLELSPDEGILYVNETVQRRIWAFDRLPSGVLTRRRLFASFPDFGLDGMRCDAAGNLYVTRYGKGTIAVLSPQAELIREVALRGREPTNLTFGGADGRTCYVTVADRGNVEAFQVEVPGRAWPLGARP